MAGKSANEIEIEEAQQRIFSEEEESYRRLLALTPEAIAIHQNGLLVFVNAAGAELVGATSPEELVGKTLLDLVHPDYRELVIARVQRTQQQGKMGELVREKFLRLDGRPIDVEVVSIPVNYRGKPASMVVVRDVTEQKRAEEALRESEERLRLASEAGGLSTWEWNIQTGEVKWSVGLPEMLGIHPGEFGGTHEAFLDMIYSEDLPLVNAALEKAIQSHSDYDLEFRVARKNGSPVWVSAQARIIYSENGLPLRMLGVVKDISERKEAEERLRRSEEIQRFLAEASRVLSSSLDYETVLQSLARLTVPAIADWCTVDVIEQEGKIRRVARYHSDPEKLKRNEEYDRFYPFNPNSANGMNNLLRSRNTRLVRQVDEETLADIAGDSRALEYLLHLGIKSSILVPLVNREHGIGILTLSTAESGRIYNEEDKALAEELAQRVALAVDNARLYREAQEAIADRETFLSVAAHELKTPITGMRGFAQLLSRQLNRKEGIDPKRLTQALQSIQEQSDKLTRLIGQLLDVSRIEAGRLVLEPKEVDLKQIVEQTVEVEQAQTNRHTLVVLAPSESLVARVDPLRIEQVITNLVDNAIKYSPEGGPVEVELALDENNIVNLSVTDWGLGIAPEHRERIFDRFYQAHLGAYLGGMGLGLHITRQIVELHHGEIKVDFPASGSTKFIVKFPRGLVKE